MSADLGDGSPLLRAFAADHRAQTGLRVAVVRWDGLGDWAMTLPLLIALRDDPSVRSVAAIGPEWIVPLLATMPGITALGADWEDEPAWLPLAARERTPIGRTLARRAAARSGRAHAGRYDLIVLPRWDVDRGWCRDWAFATGSCVAAHDPHTNPAARRRELSQASRIDLPCIAGRAGAHELQQNARLANDLGIEHVEVRGCGLQLRLPDVSGLGLPEAFVAMHMGAGAAQRRWPESSWVRLIEQLRSDLDLPTVLLGGPGDRSATNAVASLTAGSAVDCCGLPLPEMAAVLRLARAFVGNDSGPMHVACALDRPVVTVSAHPRGASKLHSNSPSRFGPWSSRPAVVQPSAAIPPCEDHCSATEPHCIASIRPADVASALTSLLNIGPDFPAE